MDTIHNWPVSLRWDSYSIQGWPVHNPNIGLHPMAGQPAADEYNTRLASQSKMDTIVRGCILVSLKSHLRANRPNPNNIGLDGSCVRWMKTEDFIQATAVPSSR